MNAPEGQRSASIGGDEGGPTTYCSSFLLKRGIYNNVTRFEYVYVSSGYGTIDRDLWSGPRHEPRIKNGKGTQPRLVESMLPWLCPMLISLLPQHQL